MTAPRTAPTTEPAPPDEEFGRAFDAALHYLSYRPRTREEVRRKLADRGFADPLIPDVLSRLEELRLLDDAAFIELYVRDRIRTRPMGVRRMASELWAKGIPRDRSIPVIERVLRDENTDEPRLARRAAEKRYRTLRGDDEASVRRRLLAFLGRRGFGSAVTRAVVNEIVPRD